MKEKTDLFFVVETVSALAVGGGGGIGEIINL